MPKICAAIGNIDDLADNEGDEIDARHARHCDGKSLPHWRSIQLRDQVGLPAAKAERFERESAPLILAQAEHRRAGDLPGMLLANTHCCPVSATVRSIWSRQTFPEPGKQPKLYI